MYFHKIDTMRIIADDFVPDFDHTEKMRIVNDIHGVIHEEFQMFLDAHNLKIHELQIFTYRANQNLGIHVDDEVVDNKAKINVIYGGEDSLVEWFQPLPGIIKPVEFSPMGTKYLKFADHETVMACSANLVGPYLVNTGVPHRVKNGNSPRVCLSMPIFLKGTDIQAQFGYMKHLLT